MVFLSMKAHGGYMFSTVWEKQHELQFKSLGSDFLWKEINTFIQQGCIQLIKSDSIFINILK